MTLLTSAVHFGDNAFRRDLYPGPAWLTRNVILIAWICVLALACLAYWRDTRRALLAYGALGFAGLAHFLMPHGTGVPMRCSLTIASEVIASTLLLAFALLRPRPDQPALV